MNSEAVPYLILSFSIKLGLSFQYCFESCLVLIFNIHTLESVFLISATYFTHSFKDKNDV